MKHVAWGALVVAVGACTGSGSATVRIETATPPAILAFREESSTQWRALAVAERSSYEIVANGPYRVVVGCNPVAFVPDFDLINLTEYARTPDDDAQIDVSCQTRPLTVTGQMLRSGSVAIGSVSTFSTAAPWGFSSAVAAGSYSVVMAFNEDAGPPSLAIRRDVAITGDTNLGAIDPAAENLQPMVPVSFTASNLEPGESKSMLVTLYSGNTIASLRSSATGNTWDAFLAPQSALRSPDRQVVSLTASTAAGDSSQSRFRTIRRQVRAGDPPVVELPPRIGPVAFETTADRVSASWGALPEYDRLVLLRTGAPEVGRGVVFQQVLVSHSFVDATGVTSAVLDFTDVPGVAGEWRLDPGASQTHQLSAVRGSNDDSVTSGAAESSTASAASGGLDEPVLLGADYSATVWAPPSIARRNLISPGR